MSMQSPEINKLAEALAKAQSEITGALKDSANPFFKSKYADLAAVWDACRLPLSKNGLSVIQTTGIGEHGPYLETTLAHSSGQWMKGQILLQPVKNDPQGMGSAITYMRRYALAAIIGVAQVDDDGNGASGKGGYVGPEQPGPDDGIVKMDQYRIPSHLGGSLGGRALEDCDPIALRDLVAAIEQKYKGKITPAAAVLFIKSCEPVIAQWEKRFSSRD